MAKALGFNGATLLLLALFAAGWSLLTGMSWLKLMERIGGGIETAIANAAQAPRSNGAIARSAQLALEQREHAVGVAREISGEEREPVVVVPSVVEVPKSERVVRERQKPLFQDLARFAFAAAGAARGRARPRRSK